MSDIAQKIAKLIALADSTTHPEEADTFMAKAQALMVAHGLSLLDLGRLDAEDPVGRDMEFYSYGNANAGWRGVVLSQLAQFYGCKTVRVSRGRTDTFCLFGRESARITVMLMWPYVYRQILSTGAELHKAGLYKGVKTAQAHVANALALRINKLVKEQQTSTPAAPRGLNALVPVDIIEQEMAVAFPNLKEGKARTVNTTRAASQAANGISLHKQAAGGAVKRLGSA